MRAVPPNPNGGFQNLWAFESELTDASRRAAPLQVEPSTGFPLREAPALSAPLRIVHVNDTHHMHFGSRPADSSATLPNRLQALRDAIGIERDRAREAETDLIFLSAGDEHTGTSLDELLGYSAEQFRTSVAYEVQSALGLDTATIGNHDLDRGPAVLERAARSSASFPLLASNIVRSRLLSSFCPAVIGVTRHGTRVGVVGVTTDEQLQVRERLDEAFRVSDPLESAVRWYGVVAQLADVVVILSHAGLNVTGSRHVSRVDDRLIARSIERASGTPVPTCIIGGHTHTLIDPEVEPVVVGSIPIFQAGCNLNHLGVVTVERGRIEGHLVRLDDRDVRPGSNGAPSWSPELGALHGRAAGLLARTVDRVIGRIRSADDVAVERVLEDRLSGECSIANLITDSVRNAALRDGVPVEPADHVVAAADASGIQSSLVDASAIRIDDLYRILPYADSVFAAIVRRDELSAILASNARRRLKRALLETHGGPIGVMDWSRIARGFLHFSAGLRYTISDPHDGVIDATIDGRPLDSLADSVRILVLCNSFSAMGNQGWGLRDDESFREFGTVSLPAMGFADTGLPYRQLLIEAVEQEGEVTIAKDGRLRIDPERE